MIELLQLGRTRTTTRVTSLLAVAIVCSAFPRELKASPIPMEEVISFDSATAGSLLHDDYFENGFRISNTAGHYDLDNGLMQIDTYAGGYSSVKLDRFGSTFDFLGFLNVLWDPHPDGLPLDEVATVTSSNGGYFEISAAGALTFSGPQWQNVSWIAFSVIDPNRAYGDTKQDNLLFDDIRVGVPEPASILLVGSGVLGLAARRRRNRWLPFTRC